MEEIVRFKNWCASIDSLNVLLFMFNPMVV